MPTLLLVDHVVRPTTCAPNTHSPPKIPNVRNTSKLNTTWLRDQTHLFATGLRSGDLLHGNRLPSEAVNALEHDAIVTLSNWVLAAVQKVSVSDTGAGQFLAKGMRNLRVCRSSSYTSITPVTPA